jgi:7-cyano-7-deazaguanine synthase
MSPAVLTFLVTGLFLPMSDPSPSAKSALVLFSGGQDSAVCLAWALDSFDRVETVGFDYGQRHSAELKARGAIRRRLGKAFPHWTRRLGADHRINLRTFGAIGESALTSERAIETDARGLPTTFVPGRNLAFLVYAAALADRLGLDALVGGMCETDYSGYPDCRRETLDAMEQVLALGIGRPFPIRTPLMPLTKADTWALAKRLGGERLVELIVTESHTCYLNSRDPHPWGAGCGACPACVLRARGWSDWAAAGRPVLSR